MFSIPFFDAVKNRVNFWGCLLSLLLLLVLLWYTTAQYLPYQLLVVLHAYDKMTVFIQPAHKLSGSSLVSSAWFPSWAERKGYRGYLAMNQNASPCLLPGQSSSLLPDIQGWICHIQTGSRSSNWFTQDKTGMIIMEEEKSRFLKLEIPCEMCVSPWRYDCKAVGILYEPGNG